MVGDARRRERREERSDARSICRRERGFGRRWQRGRRRSRVGTRITFNYSNLTGFPSAMVLNEHMSRVRSGLPRREPMIPPHTVRIEFDSAFDMLDFVQVVCDYVGKAAGLDEDQLHWVSVAVRESVVNAIKHGNKNDPIKRVIVEFSPVPPRPRRLVIRIEGPGRRLRARRSGRPAGARKHPQVERPRHLPHSQLHGRSPIGRAQDRAAWRCRMVEESPASRKS